MFSKSVALELSTEKDRKIIRMPLTSIENLSLGKENARPKKELVGKVEKNKEAEEKVKKDADMEGKLEKKEVVEEPLLKENPRRSSHYFIFPNC